MKLVTTKTVEKLLQSLNNDPQLQALDDTTILSEEQYPIAFDALIMRIKDSITLTTTVDTLNYNDTGTQAQSIPSAMRMQLRDKQVKLCEILQLKTNHKVMIFSRSTFTEKRSSHTSRLIKPPPFPYNPKLRLWTGKLPAIEIYDLILATGVIFDPHGFLEKESAEIAVQLEIDHDSTRTIEDEEEQLEQLRFANSLFTYSESTLCECSRCARLLSGIDRETTIGTKQRTRPGQ
jgi:hypothetical protein